MSREDFEGVREYAKQCHAERLAKNPQRITYAIKQLEKHDIEYRLLNDTTGHIHCYRKSDDRLFQFYAGTGKIVGYEKERGIHALIKLLEV